MYRNCLTVLFFQNNAFILAKILSTWPSGIIQILVKVLAPHLISCLNLKMLFEIFRVALI